MEAKFQIFLILLAVLAGIALLARRIHVAPAILLLLAGIAALGVLLQARAPGMAATQSIRCVKSSRLSYSGPSKGR